jgi:hypothetical protein
MTETTKQVTTLIDSKNRQQLSNVVGVELSIARIRRLITEYGINLNIRKSLSEVKKCENIHSLSEETKIYIHEAFVSIKKPTPDDIKIHTAIYDGVESYIAGMDLTAIKLVITYLISRHLIRAGDDSVCALASTANYIIEKVIKYGTSILKESGKKTLKCHHIANKGLESLDIWPFIRSLKCVKDEQNAYITYMSKLEQKKEDKKAALKAKKNDKNKESKKEEVVTVVATEVVVDNIVEVVATTEQKDKYTSDSFKHHVFSIAKVIVKNEIGGDVSDDVKGFGSKIVFEFIQRYNKLIKLQIDHSGVKTIKSDAIVTINKMVLIDEDADEFHSYVNDRLGRYAKHTSEITAAAKLKVTNNVIKDDVKEV